MKKQAEKRYVMLIDITRCIGCHTCAIACNLANNMPSGLSWNRVLTQGGEAMDTPGGTFPNLSMQYVTLACQHCEEPACVAACPSKATYKRPDGIVMQDYDKCLGCRMCVMACPYEGVRRFNEKTPEYYLNFPVGDLRAKAQQEGTVSKCHFCYHRVDQGLIPNCVGVCPAKARFFGDAMNENSEVFALLETRNHTRLLMDQKTGPSVYLLT